ncbi:hypothetical protein V496_08343 [Pseudogymnoascus sp. VKM F-4515 (FW-2607)]|nr:hypothetical protein V496_08343 [Pseudogymnoascus sp. VKM F-4515 (FW-2607)]
MSSQSPATYFVLDAGIDREVITTDISRHLGNDALVKTGQIKDQKGEPMSGYFITAYRVITTDQITEIKADSARWGAERAEYQANRGSQGRDVGYRNSLTRARQEPPSWEDAAPAQGGYPIPPQDGAVGQPSGSSKEPLGFINSKQRLAPPLKDKASKLSATAFPSYSTAERQSNQLQSNVYGAELQSNAYGAEQQSNTIGAEQQSNRIDESLPRHYYNVHRIPRLSLHDHQQSYGVPTIARQAPHSRLPTTFSTPTGPATSLFSTDTGGKLSAGLGSVAAFAVAALASSQWSELKAAKSQAISNKTEYVSDNATQSVSNFELFDNQNPSGNAADKADKADMWFNYLRVNLHPVLPRIPDKKDRIRIAVLDTGICMDDNFIQLKENRTRITYQSFVTGDKNPTEPSDLVGHGTHVAGLLLQVAPNADIYVAKISDKDELYDPNDIASAIRHSVDNWHAHIISMSFGFDNLTQKLDCIKREILYAHSEETVLFAAARNNGGVKGIAYPASQTEVICINSTDGEGNPSPFNPSPKEDKNFSTLGEAVLSSWPRSVQQRMTGTSFATPIAAGIAAVTMDYMEQRTMDWSKDDDRYVARRIKTRGGIIAVFDKHLSDPRSGFRFLCPWLMASIKRTYFRVPKWDIPPEAISLGNLIADPTEPHRPLNAAPPLRPSSPAGQTTNPPGLEIDTPIHARTFSPYSKTTSSSKKKSFSLIAQLSLLTGVGGNSSFSSTRDEGISYRARTMHSEWFVPSRSFVSAAVAQPDVAGFLALLPSKRPIYMVTGVRHVTGFTASSRSGEERSRGKGVNADATALQLPLAVGVDAERGVGAGETVEWECEGPVVFVYQLEKLTRRNGKWDQDEYTKGAFMGIGEATKDEWVVEGDSGILEGLDDDEVEVMEDGWDDLEEEACMVVVPRVDILGWPGSRTPSSPPRFPPTTNSTVARLMLTAKRGLGPETSATMTTTTSTTTTSTSPSTKRQHHERDDIVEKPRKRRQTIREEPNVDSFQVTHQEVLLLHGVKQRYALTPKYEIPQIKNDGEMLVKVTVIGLNPIDWKASDFGWGLPTLPCISGRDLAGTVVKTPKRESRFKAGDKVIAVSTDYRDSRKSAYQEYAIASDHNVCRLPASISALEAAPVGVAYVAAALMLGVCIGLDFSHVNGPDLFTISRKQDPESVPKDIRDEVFNNGVTPASRPKRGDWLAIWGGSSATGCIALQLAKLAGLRVVCILDVARNGARMLKLGADLLIDRLDTERAVEIVRSVTGGQLTWGIDTRGKESAGLLARAMSSSETASDAKAKGENGKEKALGHLVALTGRPSQPTPGIQYHTLPIKLFHEAAPVGEALMVWLERLFEEGKLHPPPIEVASGGLQGVNGALDRLREGAAGGERIVVPLI